MFCFKQMKIRINEVSAVHVCLHFSVYVRCIVWVCPWYYRYSDWPQMWEPTSYFISVIHVPDVTFPTNVLSTYEIGWKMNKIHPLLVNIFLRDDTAYSLLVKINLNTSGNLSERGIEAIYVYSQHKIFPFLHPAARRWRWATALCPSHFTARKEPQYLGQP